MDLLRNLANQIHEHADFFPVLLKMTGIAYLIEFTASSCKDAGETAIASKVELAGRILIMAMSIPILTTLLETISQLL